MREKGDDLAVEGDEREGLPLSEEKSRSFMLLGGRRRMTKREREREF